MRFVTTIAAGLLALSGISAAHAQDASFWDGFYAGIHGVGGGASADKYFTATGAYRNSWTMQGGMLGAHAGYNMSIDAFVLGIEGDVDVGSIIGDDAGNGQSLERLNITGQGSIRARAGYTIDQLLIYATAGIAFANVAGYTEDSAVPGLSAESLTRSYSGPTVGAGIELALTDSVSVRGEYRYTALGRADFAWANWVGATYSLHEHTARVGVSFHF